MDEDGNLTVGGWLFVISMMIIAFMFGHILSAYLHVIILNA